MLSVSFPFLYFGWNYIGYLMFFTHSAVFVALFIMVLVHLKIKKFLKTRTMDMVNKIASSDAPQATKSSAEAKALHFQKKISRLYLLMLSYFVGVYIPAVVMIYILYFCESCNCTFRHVLRDVSFLMISANSCINPCIYAIRVKTFRKSLMAMFVATHKSTFRQLQVALLLQ